MATKCDTVTISKEELEKLKARAKKCETNCSPKKKKTTTKKTAAKKPKKAVRKTAKTRTKPKTVRKTAKTKKPVKTKSKANSKAKSKSVSRNTNYNANAISVDVRANPKAVSNVYIVSPPQTSAPVIQEAPKRKRDREVPYNAPYLQRRDGSAPRLPAPRQTTVKYIEKPASTPRMPVIVIGGRKGKKNQEPVATIPATTQAQIPASTTAALPAPNTIYYELPDGSSVPLEDCRLIDDPTEKSACQKRNRKKARLE